MPKLLEQIKDYGAACLLNGDLLDLPTPLVEEIGILQARATGAGIVEASLGSMGPAGRPVTDGTTSGIFLDWSIHHDTHGGSYVVAIVELPDGNVRVIGAGHIRFTDVDP